MDFIEWFKSAGVGFVRADQVPEDVKASLDNYLAHTSKIGVYASKLFNEDGSLSHLELGYYVRSKNPFKWQFRKTAGNHNL